MATVIDSLIVTLGLDPSDFTKGQKEAAQALVKTKEVAVKSGKDIEGAAKSAANFMSQLRGQVLLLFAAFTGGKGIASFTQEIITSSAAIGRMSVLLGTTTGELSKWQGMSSAFGGSAAGITSSINSLNQSLQQLSLTGESSVIPYLRALQAAAPGVNLSLQGANGQIRTAIDLLPDLHRAFQGMDAARAAAIGHGLGLSDELINILIQSDEVFNKFMADQQRWGTVTKEQAKAAQELQYAGNGVIQSFSTLGRILMADLAPLMSRFLNMLINGFVWLQKHPEELKKIFYVLAAGFAALALYIAGPIAWIGALAAAIYALYDDWATYNEGGKAKFGEFWQSVNDGWAKIRDYALEIWGEIKQYVEPILDALKVIFAGFVQYVNGYFKLLHAVIFGTADDIRKAWAEMVGGMQTMWSGLWDNMADAVLNAAPAIFSAIKKAVGEALGWVTERINVVWEAITGKKLFGENGMDLGPGGASPAGGTGPGGVFVPGRGGDRVNYTGPQAAGYTGKGVTNAKMEEDIQYFMSKGWSRDQAIGIVSNIAAESGGSHTKVGDNGLAFGLAQWHPDRRAKFQQLYGKRIEDSTREEQREFINWELNNSEKAAGDLLRKTGSATDAAGVVSRYYERPRYADTEAFRRGVAAAAIARAPAPSIGAPSPGAPTAAVTTPGGPTMNDNSRQSSTQVQQVIVNTQATDAAGIARDIKPALERDSYATQANYSYM